MNDAVVELSPVVRSIEVKRSAADAFRIFTQEMTAWWPLATHTRAKTAEGEKSVSMTVEQRVGGRIYETLTTGEERDWGLVTALEPPRRFAMAFHIFGKPENATDLDIRFEPLGAGRCRVTLTHTGWERLSSDVAALRTRFVPGWMAVFDDGFGGYAGKV